jgi:hypothetical protein
MVTVKMTSTVYYGPRGDKRRYGPGEAVEVPESLATALGLTPIYVAPAEPHQAPAAEPSDEPEDEKAKPARSTGRKPKAAE